MNYKGFKPILTFKLLIMSLVENKDIEWSDNLFDEIHHYRFVRVAHGDADDFLYCYCSASEKHYEANCSMLKQIYHKLFTRWYLGDLDHYHTTARMLRDMTSVAPMHITDFKRVKNSIDKPTSTISLNANEGNIWCDLVDSSGWRKFPSNNLATNRPVLHINVTSLDGNFLVYDRWHTLSIVRASKGIANIEFPPTKLFECGIRSRRTKDFLFNGYVKRFNEECFEVKMEKGSQIDLVYGGLMQYESIIHIIYP
jgi:hypothetical protein